MDASIVLQPNDEGSLDAKLGLISHEETYEVPDLPTALSFVPDAPPLGMAIVRRHWKRRKSGSVYDVVLGYEGHVASLDGEDFSLDAADQLDPIEMFKDLKDLMAKYNGQPKDDGHVYFPPGMPNPATNIPGIPNPSSIKNPLFGVTEYHNPGYVWTWTFISVTIPGFVVSRLGTIDAPESRADRTPPELDGNRNWLCIRGKADWHGNIWKISLSWLMSGPGGWSEDLYQA